MSREQASARAGGRVDLREPETESRAWGQAMDYIVSILGTAWLERELDAPKDRGYLLLGGDEDDDDDLSAYLRLHRVVLLAQELSGAQGIRGFEHLVKGLRARTSYEAVAEPRAINHMARAVKPPGSLIRMRTRGRLSTRLSCSAATRLPLR